MYPPLFLQHSLDLFAIFFDHFLLADSQEDIHESGTKGTRKKREGTSVDKGMLLHILQIVQYEQLFFCKNLPSNSLPFHPFYLSNRMNPFLVFVVSNHQISHNIHSDSSVAYNAC